MREEFDFTKDGRRPSAARIIAAWKRAGRPDSFAVVYGETFAEFERNQEPGNYYRPWNDSGNGCEGVKRSAVVQALMAEEAKPCPRCGGHLPLERHGKWCVACQNDLEQ